MSEYRNLTSSKTSQNAKEKEINGFRNEDAKKNGPTHGEKLFKIDEMPDYLRFNQFVKHGYRRRMNAKECCQSLLFFHNETVNIYSHAISGIFMLFWIPYASISSVNENYMLYILHYIGCLSPFIGSTIYHLFMCHDSGAVTYDYLLKFDMFGIWAINTFGGITVIKATLFCSTYIKQLSLALYMLTGFIILYFILTAKNVKQRFRPMILFGVFRYGFLAIRGALLYYNIGAGDPQAIFYYILMDLAALLGGILNITGKLDCCFNSHNIMHIVVTFCPILLHWGAMLDFKWMAIYHC